MNTYQNFRDHIEQIKKVRGPYYTSGQSSEIICAVIPLFLLSKQELTEVPRVDGSLACPPARPPAHKIRKADGWALGNFLTPDLGPFKAGLTRVEGITGRADMQARITARMLKSSNEEKYDKKEKPIYISHRLLQASRGALKMAASASALRLLPPLPSLGAASAARPRRHRLVSFEARRVSPANASSSCSSGGRRVGPIVLARAATPLCTRHQQEEDEEEVGSEEDEELEDIEHEGYGEEEEDDGQDLQAVNIAEDVTQVLVFSFVAVILLSLSLSGFSKWCPS